MKVRSQKRTNPIAKNLRTPLLQKNSIHGRKKMVARYLTFSAHCRDCFVGTLLSEDEEPLDEHFGYVPNNLGIGGGDAVTLTIDLETGQIVNWKPINVSTFGE